MKDKNVKKIVKDSYSEIAKNKSCSCCGNVDEKEIAKSIGYSDEEIETASEANLGLGCGNPIALAKIKEGDIVLDLGSGAGFDSFLAVFHTGLKIHNNNFEEAFDWVYRKIEKDWVKITLPEATEMMSKKYKAIKLLLDSTREIQKESAGMQ